MFLEKKNSRLIPAFLGFAVDVAEKDKLIFYAKMSDAAIYKYDIPTGTQTAIYTISGAYILASLYWDSTLGHLWIMGDGNKSTGSEMFPLTVIDADGNVVRATQDMPGRVRKASANGSPEATYCVVGRKMYLRTEGKGSIVSIDLDTFATQTISTGMSSGPSYLTSGFESENILFFTKGSYAGYLDTTTNTSHWFDFSYNYEASKYPAMVSAGWGQYDKAYMMRIYSYRKPDGSIGHRIMIQGEKANSTPETQYKWYIFEIDLDKISTDKYNCIVDGSHQSINMNMGSGSIDGVTKGGLDVIVNSETKPGLMFFVYTSGQFGSGGNFVAVSNDGGLTQSHFMGVGETSYDVNWVNTYGIWADAGVVDGNIWIGGTEGFGSLEPYIKPGSAMLAYDGKNVRVPSEQITNFFFDD